MTEAPAHRSAGARELTADLLADMIREVPGPAPTRAAKPDGAIRAAATPAGTIPAGPTPADATPAGPELETRLSLTPRDWRRPALARHPAGVCASLGPVRLSVLVRRAAG